MEDVARYYGVKFTDKTMSWYTIESLGEKRQETPEGFMLCLDVPVARTGVQIYERNEVPGELTPDGDGYVRVEREPTEVFRPETIASFQGKPVVDEHPVESGKPLDINPENWNKYSVGVTINPRQGEGDQADFMLADLLICNKDAIQAINEGKREVSAGYEASYESTGDGKARQFNIVGNHIALVKNARCGPRCSIQDHAIDCSCQETPEPEPVKDEVPPIIPKKVVFRPILPKPNISVRMGDGMKKVHIHIHRDGGPGSGPRPSHGLHPESMSHRGDRYKHTGRTRLHSSGEHHAEYSKTTHYAKPPPPNRVWRSPSGKIHET